MFQSPCKSRLGSSYYSTIEPWPALMNQTSTPQPKGEAFSSNPKGSKVDFKYGVTLSDHCLTAIIINT